MQSFFHEDCLASKTCFESTVGSCNSVDIRFQGGDEAPQVPLDPFFQLEQTSIIVR